MQYGQGFRRVGKRQGTFGTLNKYEASAKPYEFAAGTVWATSLRGAKIKIQKEFKQKYG